MSELIRLAKAGSGAVQREVERLAKSGLISIDGEPKRIHASPSSALSQELAAIFSPTLYTSSEFRRRRASNHPFLTKVLGDKHIVLLGSEDAVPLDNLVATGKLRTEPAAPAELEGLLRSGAVRLADAEKPSNRSGTVEHALESLTKVKAPGTV